MVFLDAYNQTAKVTEKNSSQIYTIQSESDETVQAVQGIVQVISHVSKILTAIESVIEKQGTVKKSLAMLIKWRKEQKNISRNIFNVLEATSDARVKLNDV